MTLEHKLSKLFVLLKNDRKVFCSKSCGFTLRANNRLHAKLCKAKLEHLFNILQEVGIFVSKRTSHIVRLSLASLDKLLELRNYLFPASVTCIVNSVFVVDFLTSVKAKYHVGAFLVCKVDYVVVDKNAVSCKCKSEILACRLFNRACISHKSLNYVKVHKRLAAKEVNLKVSSALGICNEEVERLLTNLIAHNSSVAVIFTLGREAVGAVEVTNVRNVETKRLYNSCTSLLKLACHTLEAIGCEKLALCLKLFKLCKALVDFTVSYLSRTIVLFKNNLLNFILRLILIHFNNIIRSIVNHVNRA